MHIHTNYSDGNNSVEEIFEMAAKECINTISITDHNTVKAYIEEDIRLLSSKYNIKVIPGVELKCSYENKIIELLVYDFNIIEVDKLLEKIYLKWEYINKNITNEFSGILDNKNIEYNKEILLNHDYNKYNGIMEIYKSVISYESNIIKLEDEYTEDIASFFRNNVCNANSNFYVDINKYYPKVKEIVDYFKNTEAKIFMPHVFLFDNGFEILESLVENKYIQGVECYHSSYSEENTECLINFADAKNVYKSAGSDFHGSTYNLGIKSKYYNEEMINFLK